MTQPLSAPARHDSVPSFESYGGSAPENYERYFVPAIGRPLAEDLVAHARCEPGERVIDLGCGTGIVARLAADRVGGTGRVVGLDLNAGMLAVARATTPALDWREGHAASIPFADATFDVVFCQMALQFFSDKLAALREARRVLGRGGRLVLNVPGPVPPLFAAMADAVARHVSPEAAGFIHGVFSVHDPTEVAALLRAAGFEDADAAAQVKVLRLPAPRAFLWEYIHSTPLVAVVAKLDTDRRAALENDVLGCWDQFKEAGGLRLELSVTTATGRR